MPAWLTILLVMGLTIAVLTPSRQQFAWFLRLRRPRWLTFERWIPLIWSVVYLCFYASALIRWQVGGTTAALTMAAYLVLLVLVQSYTLLICRTRRLVWGTAAGLSGWFWGLGLALALLAASRPASLLLVPFLLWSPIGTFVTWRMQKLNR
jgi:tryptophan-rich sensory protein